jgi:hypothetical protein
MENEVINVNKKENALDLTKSLEQVGFQVEKEKNVENTYRLSFLLNEIVSTIRIVLDYDRNEIALQI